MNDQHELELLLRGDNPILVLEGRDEPRLLEMLSRITLRLMRPLFAWSVTRGLYRADVDIETAADTEAPGAALREINARKEAGVYVLLDFHPYLEEPQLVRLVREIAQARDAPARTLVFLSHRLEIPEELGHLSVRFQPSMPDENTLRDMVRAEVKAWREQQSEKVRADPESVKALVRHLSGVSHADARRLIRQAIKDGAITDSDIPELLRAKHEILSRDGVLQLEHETANFAEVAGLDRLKEWLIHRREVFLDPQQGLDPPRGILLLGIQGGGKSLAAKATAGLFGAPLLRLDMGSLYDKYIGETERRLRQALRSAEMMAPCVMWIDEIEKGIAGGDQDHGTSARVLGTLLTWMAERPAPVFITATANDISKLPPELLRKGRFDEIFFVDLPTGQVRGEIFSIHLRKRGLEATRFDLDRLADASEGFSGAEIEQAVVSMLYHSRSLRQEPDDQAIIDSLARTRPLSVLMAERIAELRRWAAGRTVSAH